MPAQPLSLTPRKKNLRLVSNKSKNVISLAVLSSTGNLRISCQKPHKNVTAPRALRFDATREFPRERVLREIAQQDRKMQQQGGKCLPGTLVEGLGLKCSLELTQHNPLVAHRAPTLSSCSRLSDFKMGDIGMVCSVVLQVGLRRRKGLALKT